MTDISKASSETQDSEGYVLPAENAAEMARLMLQDHMFTRALGGPLPEQTDISELHEALDIGCGPGGVALRPGDAISAYAWGGH